MNTNIEEQYSILPFFKKFEEVLKRKVGAKKEPVILLQGGFGKHNTGDDTLMLVAREEILKVYPNAKIYALCHNPEFLKRDYGIEGIKFKSLATIKALFKSDALVVPAGGLVNNIDYNSYIKSLFNPRGKFVFLSMLIMILRHKCTVVFGVGIHDMPDFIVKILAKIVLPRVDLLAVRDKHTVKVVEKLGCTDFYFSHDPVIAYKKKVTYNWESYKQNKNIPFDDFIVLNYRMTKNSEETQRALETLSEYMQYISENYPSMGIILMPFSIHPTFKLENDVIAMRKLIKKAREKYNVKNYILLKEYLTADDVKTIAEHAKLLILTRHHAPVITYSCHIPTIVISYNFKCREFAELGEYKYIIDYDKLTVEELKEITDNECSEYKR